MKVSSDYLRGGLGACSSFSDPGFPDYLASLSCFRYLSSSQIQQLVQLFTPVEFHQHE